jgi:hypothetical protein
MFLVPYGIAYIGLEAVVGKCGCGEQEKRGKNE